MTLGTNELRFYGGAVSRVARIPQKHGLGLDPGVDTGFAIRIRASH
jgi:hypothetical protein